MLSQVEYGIINFMRGDIYHVLNRGVEKRDIFLDSQDYFRFRDNLKDFNCKNPVTFSHYDRHNFNLGMHNPGEELVDILCVCIMSNHYHLLIREKVDGGVGLFAHKIGIGYTHYFNQKNKRSGVLFQGRTKKILVEKDAHFIHLPYYILANPVKLIEPNWKEEGVKNKKTAVEFLDKYKWVSFRDIISKEKGVFEEVINKKLFLETFGYKSGNEFQKDFLEWMG